MFASDGRACGKQGQRWACSSGRGTRAGLFILALLLTDSLRAQAPAPERIYFSALSREEKPQMGLAPSDFLLKLNGHAAKLEDFRAGTAHTDRSRPLVAWILLRSSRSMSSRVITEQAASAAAFFDMLHPDSALGVKLVSDRAVTLAPLTRDREEVRRAFVRFAESRNEVQASPGSGTVLLKRSGIWEGVGLAVADLSNFCASEPSLQGRDVLRAVILISTGYVRPLYHLSRLADEAARLGVFFYAVLVPQTFYGFWERFYFDLAKETAGMVSSLGALSPENDFFKRQAPNLEANALMLNFVHIIRDLNGKYSFGAPQVPPGGKVELELRCLKKEVRVRLARKRLP